MTEIRKARLRAEVTGAELAHAVGCSRPWLNLAENGAIPLPPEHEKIIMTAIGRLQRFHATVAEAKEKLTQDLRLPSLARTI
jgi:transcriptional regulator with XRE-family HTH domain